MASIDLSQHIELQSTRPATSSGSNGPARPTSVCQQHEAKRRGRGSRVFSVNRVAASRGAGEEMVTCMSLKRASSLAFVVLFLWHHIVPMSATFAMLGAAASTVSIIHEMRQETLALKNLRRSLREGSEKLKRATNELRQAERELAEISRPAVDFVNDNELSSWVCSVGGHENML